MSRRCIVRSESLQVHRAHTHTHRTRRQTDRVSVRERGSETAFHQRWQTHRLLMASVVVKRLGRQLPDIDIWDASLCLALTRFFTRSPPHPPLLFLPFPPLCFGPFPFRVSCACKFTAAHAFNANFKLPLTFLYPALFSHNLRRHLAKRIPCRWRRERCVKQVRDMNRN